MSKKFVFVSCRIRTNGLSLFSAGKEIYVNSLTEQ